MSIELDDTVDSLPDIIKSLAQQLSGRDAQLKIERAKYIEKLSVMREEQDAIRSERDQLAEDFRKEKVLYATKETAFNLEKAEFLKKIELLEQAAIHQADVLSQTRYELEQWKGRYVTAADESRRQWEECASHLSGMANRLDELAGVRRQSDSGSSPTVVSSMSPNKPTSADKAPPATPCLKRLQAAVISKTPNPVSTPGRATSPTLRQTRVIPANSAIAASRPSHEMGHLMPSRIRETSNAGGTNPSYPALRSQSLTGKVESPSILMTQHSPRILQSALPPDRVIVTAHYELKEEESDDGDLTYPESSSSKNLYPRVEDEDNYENENEIEVPSAKRKRIATRRQSSRHINDDDVEEQDDADADEVYQQVEGRKRLRQSNGQEDFDDMAIGAEHNHKEIYGYRRVHVREVNARSQTSSAQRTRNGGQSGAFGNHRKVASHGRPVPSKTRR